jgi:PKD repeat protein
VSYAWSYGDGSTGAGVIVSHAYAHPGTYVATLTVTDNKGATGVDTATITVANRVPTANAGPDRTVVEDSPVTFDASASSDPDGTITGYSWTFGDGTTGTGVRPVKTYPAPGTYIATVTVTDDKGASNSDSATYTVTPKGGPGWADAIGDVGVDVGFGVASDAAGNVFTTGTFTGSITIGTTQLTSTGASDVYLVKYDNSGTVLWAKRFGGALDDAFTALAVDPNGDLVAVGRFQGTANFGGQSLVSAGGTDMVVAKFRGADGAPIWSKRFGDASDQSCDAVSVDPSGNIAITGFYVGSVNFGGTTLRTPYVGDYDVFVAKLDPNGNHLWSKNFPNTGNDFGLGVATDAAGEVAVVGYFNASINLGAGDYVAANGLTDAFVVKLSSTGGYVWSRQIGADDGGETGKAIAMDPAGNVVVAGEASMALDLGGGLLQPFGFTDVWVGKYDPRGAHIWSRRIGGQNNDVVSGVAIDANGNVLLEGNFRWTADFGGTSLTAVGYEDAYVAKYTATGALVWAEQFGGLLSDLGSAVAVTPAGEPLIAGTFNGSGGFAGDMLVSLGQSDGFVAKLMP